MDALSARIAVPNPFATIWTQPRSTVRHLLDTDPTRHVLQLAMAGGVAQSMSQGIGSGVGDTMELPAILGWIFLIGSLYGLVAIYLGSPLSNVRQTARRSHGI